MQLVGGEFYCPLIPTPLITAGATYIDSRTDEDRAHALNLIQSRKDYQTKIKEYQPAGNHRRPRRPRCPYPGSPAGPPRLPLLFPQMRGAGPGSPPPHRANHEAQGSINDELPVSHMTRPVIRERSGTIS